MKLPALISDPLARRKAALHEIKTDRYQIRLARTAQEYRDAFRLVHVGYVFQGIESLKEVDLRITEQHVLAESIVLVAYEGPRIVGTISITQDSPAGLPLDKDYPEELLALRHSGGKLSEIGSLAIVRRCWHTGLMPLLALAAFRVAFRIHKSTQTVIGVHPRAEGYYRALWDSRAIGPARRHAELDAPVLGMVHERSSVERHMTRHFRRPMQAGVPAADYVFGQQVPQGLQLPEDIAMDDWSRFKMPREVFRDLFIHRSDRISEMSAATQAHLRAQRTEQTVGMRSDTIAS